MTATQTMRDWWADSCCDVTERFPFPKPNGEWANLLVATESIPVWAAVSQIMESEPYLFVEKSGGTFNCRKIGGGDCDCGEDRCSLHAFGIALDLNPKKNPQRNPLTHNYPPTFITRMEGIKADGKKALTWGGRWTSVRPDAMHWQLDVSPASCAGTITWDKGEPMAEGPNGEPNWDEVSEWAKNAWTKAHAAGVLTEDSHPRNSLEVEELMVYLARADVI